MTTARKIALVSLLASAFLAGAAVLRLKKGHEPPLPAHEDCVGMTPDQMRAAYGEPALSMGTEDGLSMSMTYRRREWGGNRLAVAHFGKDSRGVMRCFRVAPVLQEDGP
jgi:hypothetical protein